MLKMFTSASRIVLVIITLTVCAGFLMGKLEAKEFMMLAGMVFAYYFTKTNSNEKSDYTE